MPSRSPSRTSSTCPSVSPSGRLSRSLSESFLYWSSSDGPWVSPCPCFSTLSRCKSSPHLPIGLARCSSPSFVQHFIGGLAHHRPVRHFGRSKLFRRRIHLDNDLVSFCSCPSDHRHRRIVLTIICFPAVSSRSVRGTTILPRSSKPNGYLYG